MAFRFHLDGEGYKACPSNVDLQCTLRICQCDGKQTHPFDADARAGDASHVNVRCRLSNLEAVDPAVQWNNRGLLSTLTPLEMWALGASGNHVTGAGVHRWSDRPRERRRTHEAPPFMYPELPCAPAHHLAVTQSTRSPAI